MSDENDIDWDSLRVPWTWRSIVYLPEKVYRTVWHGYRYRVASYIVEAEKGGPRLRRWALNTMVSILEYQAQRIERALRETEDRRAL